MIATALLIVCLSPWATVSLPGAGEPAAAPLFADQAGAPTPVASGLQAEPAWSFELGTLRQTQIVRAGPVGQLLLAEDARFGLTSVDPLTGHPVWFVQLPGPLSAWPTPGIDRLALACGPEIIVVDAHSGSRRFTLQSGSLAAGSPVADHKALYLPTLLHDRIVATDVATGRMAWEYRLDAPITTSAQIIGSELRRSVLVGCADGTLRALPTGVAAPDGERWVARIGGIVDQPVVNGDRVLVSSTGFVLYALDAGSGNVLWKHFPGEALRTAPVVAGELAVFRTDTRLIAVHLADGTPAWEQEVRLSPVGALDGLLLCRARNQRSELRSATTGLARRTDLPMDCWAVHDRLVMLRGGVELLGWEFAPQ